jgi:glycosyltransferase involved in cell wall biosynthesis
MRILLISHTCVSRLEGQPRARHLSRIADVNLHVLVPSRWWEYTQWRYAERPAPGAEFDYTVGQVRIPWAGPGQWYLHHYKGLAKLLREFKPDVIDLWEEPWGLVSVQACWLRNRLLPNTKIVMETEQNVDKRLPPPFEQMRSYTMANADFAIGRNPEAIEILRRKGYAGPAEVVPNAVDTDLFRPMDRAACRAELGMESGPDTYWIGYVGRLVEQKGGGDLLTALAACPPNFKLLFVGEGPFERNLRDQIARLRLDPDRVKFVPPVPLHQVATVMNAVDVLALPSRTTNTWKEQFGRVIIEAHACGIPVVGSDSGAIPSVIGDGGLTFPEGNAAELATALRALASDPELRHSLGAAGRRQANQAYTWDCVAEQMHGVYGRLLQPANAVAVA